ncbi:MAG: site-specific integrase [Bacteroidetes bacterium]|nr:site-specific integrase [Bacteroidota bacterium]
MDRSNVDRLYPIYLYANVNGKVKYFTTNHAVAEKAWNPKKQEVSGSYPNAQTINNDIARYRSWAEKIRIDADQDGANINLFEFEKIFRGGAKDLSDVFEFIKNDLQEFKNTYAKDTLKMYQSQSKKLKGFRATLSFTEITPFFWKLYDSYLIKLGNNANTRWKAFRTIKTYINKAIEAGILKTDPLRGVKVRKPEGNRQFLTQDELKSLEILYKGFLTKDLKTVLTYFLFSCYTGLRYEDVRTLKYSNVFIEPGNSYLQFTQHKTKQAENMPLGSKAISLIPKNGLQNQPLFKVYTNQVTNRHLKSLMTLAKINKDISFHCARHTFATIGLELSGDIATVSKLLGHRKIQTTQIYAKVLDKSKRGVIDLMDAI